MSLPRATATLLISSLLISGCGGGGSSTASAPSKVADTVPPVITLNGTASLELSQGETYVEQGASAIDNIDGQVTVTTVGTVGTEPGV